MAFCSLCTAIARDDADLAPTGDNDALECRRCRGETPVAKTGPKLQYEPRGNVNAAKRAIDAGYTKMIARGKIKPGTLSIGTTRTFTMREGYVLHRVPIRKNGQPRDWREAAEDLVDEPWAADARYLTSARGFHLFERPPDK